MSSICVLWPNLTVLAESGHDHVIDDGSLAVRGTVYTAQQRSWLKPVVNECQRLI